MSCTDIVNVGVRKKQGGNTASYADTIQPKLYESSLSLASPSPQRLSFCEPVVAIGIGPPASAQSYVPPASSPDLDFSSDLAGELVPPCADPDPGEHDGRGCVAPGCSCFAPEGDK